MADLNTPKKAEQRTFTWNGSTDVWFVCPTCGKNLPWMFDDKKPIIITEQCDCGQMIEREV